MRILWIPLVMAILACAPKTMQTPTTPSFPFTLSMSHVDMRSGNTLDVPEKFEATVVQSLNNRHAITRLPVDQYPDDLARRSLPAQRAHRLSDHAKNSGVFVLVEAKARFYSQLRGQNRWVVSVETTAFNANHPDETLTRSFEVPVFLQFTHQREAEALESAAPTIAVKLKRLLRDAEAWSESE